MNPCREAWQAVVEIEQRRLAGCNQRRIQALDDQLALLASIGYAGLDRMQLAVAVANDLARIDPFAKLVQPPLSVRGGERRKRQPERLRQPRRGLVEPL